MPATASLPAWIPLACAIVALAFAASLRDAQFFGEDELAVMQLASSLLDSLRRGDLARAAADLIRDNQPPLRHILAMPGVLMFGPTEVAPRAVPILLWAGCAAVIARMAGREGGPAAALLSGLLAASSGLFAIQAMGHAFSALTLALLLAMDRLAAQPSWSLAEPAEKRSYLVAGACIALGFCVFTSAIVVAAAFHGLHAAAALAAPERRTRVAAWLRLTLPFAAFYAAYYAVFVGLPAYMAATGAVPGPFGQYLQLLARGETAALNAASLSLNLQSLNGYVVPVAGIAWLAAGLVRQAARHRGILLTLLPYALVFSFYLRGNTEGHFPTYFAVVLPFGTVGVMRALGAIRPTLRHAAWAALPCVVAWSVTVHIVRYDESEWPQRLLDAAWGKVLWRNNLVRPVDALAGALRGGLSDEDRWVSLVDGALAMHYVRDSRFIDLPAAARRHMMDGCLPGETLDASVKAVVHWEALRFCAPWASRVQRFPGSTMVISWRAHD
ncbi:MAG: hypothetical protein JNK11_08335 [Alphaproteobacteria bacterium]|nr:hypothetical protein [Alphaproteobacteria bacterium]